MIYAECTATFTAEKVTNLNGLRHDGWAFDYAVSASIAFELGAKSGPCAHAIKLLENATQLVRTPGC